MDAEASAFFRGDEGPFDGIRGQVLRQVLGRQHIGDQDRLEVIQVIVGGEIQIEPYGILLERRTVQANGGVAVVVRDDRLAEYVHLDGIR